MGSMGVADKRQHSREIQFEYSFDRLSDKKIMLAYRALIPDKFWTTGHEPRSVLQTEEIIEDEAGSDLCPSLLRATEDG